MSEPRFDHGTGAALAARDREIERLKDAGGRLRYHVQGLMNETRGPAREQIVKDLKNWVAAAKGDK